MKRTSVGTKKANLFGTGKHGFTDGSPGVEAATILESTVMNSVQEELARAVEDAGLTLSSANLGQLSRSISARAELAALVDLRNWNSGGADQLNAAAVNSDGSAIVLVGSNGKIFTSTLGDTGLTSRTAASGYTGSFKAVIWNGVAFVACGTAGMIQTSPDGTNWTARSSGTAVDLNDLAFDWNGAVVAVGNTGGVTIVSVNNGIAWSAGATLNGGTYQTNSITNLSANPFSTWVLGGPNSSITKNLYRSTDAGTTWTAVDLTGIVLSTDRVISVGTLTLPSGQIFVGYVQVSGGDSSAKIITSPDGLTWTLVYAAADATVRRMGVGRTCIALLPDGPWGSSPIKASKDAITFKGLGIPKMQGTRLQLLRGDGFSLWCLLGSTADVGKGQFSRAIVD